MYIPELFREDRPEVLAAAIRDIKLATLVTAAADGLEVTHLPLILKEDADRWVLHGHMARQNDHGASLDVSLASVAIFQGPQAYVTPRWYESKRRHGKVVPTWNYVTAHAHGTLERIDDPAWLLANVEDLTRANEAGREHPWAVTDAPADFVDQMVRAIYGVKLVVERIEGKWKMSQNRQAVDREGTIAGLAASANAGDREVAALMRDMGAGKHWAP